MKITIKVEEQGKRGRWKAIKVWEYKTRNMEFIEWMEGKIQSFETRRLRTCSWRRKGDNLRAREKSKLSRSCFKLSHELMSCLWPVRRSFLTESIVFSVSIREIAYSQSLKRQSTDSNKSIVGEPTTTTTMRAMNKTQTLLEINAAIAPCLIQTEVTFQLHRTWRFFSADGIIRCLLYDDFLWPHIPHPCL